MECCIVCSADVSPRFARINLNRADKYHVGLTLLNLKRLEKSNGILIGRSSANYRRSRVLCKPANLEEEFAALQSKNVFKNVDSDPDDSSEEATPKVPSSEELKALLADSERSKLLKKLSQANQQYRILKRQLQVKEDALVDFKKELSLIDLEIQALIKLAEEISNYSIPDGSRKINGMYIQSHLLSRLGAVQKKLEEQIKDVDSAKSKEVPLFWHGVAESVRVMGSFDGWIQGEDLSPEYTDAYTTFSTTLLLRPGRYEIKFLVDEAWQLSPEFPTVGEGLMQNNLLIVE